MPEQFFERVDVATVGNQVYAKCTPDIMGAKIVNTGPFTRRGSSALNRGAGGLPL